MVKSRKQRKRSPNLPLAKAKELLRRRLELDAPLTRKQIAAQRVYQTYRSVYKETGGQSSHWVISDHGDDDVYFATPRGDNRVFHNLGEGSRWAGHGVWARWR